MPVDKKMRVVVLGTLGYTIQCAKAVMDSGAVLAGIISMPVDARPANSVDIEGFAQKTGVPYFECEDINASEALKKIRSLSPDYIISTWCRILGNEFLVLPRKFVIGSHPTALPYNRGRHPFHWMIVQGLSQTALTFFRMDAGVDTGDVLSQVSVEIRDGDTVTDLISRVDQTAYTALKELLGRLSEDPSFVGKQQDHTQANYWRKRTPYDVTLDLRMTAADIQRTVRSYLPPYPCAKLVFGQHVLKISGMKFSERVFSLEELKRMEPGKVLSVSERCLAVKAADAVIELEVLETIPEPVRVAKYIHPPARYFCEYPQELKSKIG